MKCAPLVTLGFFFVSLLLARLWLNSALLWDILSYVPRTVWEALVVATEPITSSDVHAQEELVEFVASWLVALISLAIVGGVALLTRLLLAHGKQRGRAQ